MGSMEARDVRRDLKMAPTTVLPSARVTTVTRQPPDSGVNMMVGRAWDASFAIAALWAIIVLMLLEWAKDQLYQIWCCLPETIRTAIVGRPVIHRSATVQTDPEPVPQTRNVGCQTELTLMDQAIEIFRVTANTMIPNVIKDHLPSADPVSQASTILARLRERLPGRSPETTPEKSILLNDKTKCQSEPRTRAKSLFGEPVISEINPDWLDINIST